MFCGKGTASFIMNGVLGQDWKNRIYSHCIICFHSYPLSTSLVSVHLRLMIVVLQSLMIDTNDCIILLNRKEGQGESSTFGAPHQENDCDSDGDAFFLILWPFQNIFSLFAATTTIFLFTGLQFRVIPDFTCCVLCLFVVYFFFIFYIKTKFTQVLKL